MALDQFLAEYSGHILGAFGLGWGSAVLITYFKQWLEKL